MAGPKSSSKGKKKGKSSKLSKAEKERLKKEEQERKAQEEEDAKIRAEVEAKEREEREKHEQEERIRLEEKERAQHQAEIDELNKTIQEMKKKLNDQDEDRKVKEKWDRYMLCDGRPDPTSKKELNTYMNLWKDDTCFKPFEEIFKECELTLELIFELEKYLEEDCELGIEEKSQYKESIDEMHRLLNSKIDEAMMWLLKVPGNNIDQETLNLQVKSAEFLKEGFIIEIPRSLVLADVAVRLLQKYYNNLSPRCSTYFLKLKKNAKDTEKGDNNQIDNTDNVGNSNII
eukprot:gene18299-20122_t